MKTSLAALFEGTPGKIALREIPLPDPREGEILVRVLGCTICGSDLHSFEGRRTVPTPTILGHEIVGEIVEFGSHGFAGPQTAGTKEKLQRGDRVTWAIVANCGVCAMCQRGLPQKCLAAVKYGHEAFRPGKELLGGLAEYCLLVKGTAVVRLPDALPLEVACPASCATATIVAAVEAAGEVGGQEVAGREVVVFGAGMLGLSACALLRAHGAANIVCVDPVESRRELATAFGATNVWSPEEWLESGGAGQGGIGYDAMLELSGSPQAFESGWPKLRIGGTMVLVGAVFPGKPVELPLEQIVRRHLTIRGVHNYAPRHLQKAVEFLANHHTEAPFAGLVKKWFPLKQAADAFEEGRAGGAIRIGVRME